MSFLFDAGGLSDGGIEMIRKIVEIKEEACIGCGRCAEACHEGAIVMVDGGLIRDDYCDGLGDCLPGLSGRCYQNHRERSGAYDEEAVQAHILSRKQAKEREIAAACRRFAGTHDPALIRIKLMRRSRGAPGESQLTMWPVQIQLAPVNAGFSPGLIFWSRGLVPTLTKFSQ